MNENDKYDKNSVYVIALDVNLRFYASGVVMFSCLLIVQSHIAL